MNEALRHLPQKLAEIAEVVGIEAALKMSEAWPGQRVYVPKTVSSEDALALHIGLKLARKLAEVYGGETVVVPMASMRRRQILRFKALEKYEAGATASEVSREFGVHLFSLYRWASEAEREKQGSLL